jgi:PAS domain S-box-containing protein
LQVLLDFYSGILYYIKTMAMRNGLNSESKCGYNTPYISTASMMIHCLIVTAVLLCSPAGAQGQLQKRTGRTRNVLLINSYRPTYDWTRQTTKGIEDTFTQYKDRIELEIEYMHSRHFEDEKHYENLYELYKHKASSRKYDVIIAADDNAFRFMRQHREELYPNVPVVFCGIQEIDNIIPEGDDFLTGVYEYQVFEPTLQLVLKLHPSAEQIVIVSDGTVDRTAFMHEQWLEVIKNYENRVHFVNHFLRKLTADELLEKIGDLDPHSVVILTDSFRDPEGNLYSFEDNAEKIYQQCKAPIYTMSEEWFGLGPVVGGHIITGTLQGQAAAEIAIRILDGEKPGNIPPPPQTPSMHIFDYVQLQNFGIPLSELPEGSTIRNMPESFYQQHKKLVWSTIIAIVILISTIVVLTINTLLRRKAEKALEEQSAILNTIPDAAWLKDKNSKYIAVNEQFAEFCGIKPQNIVGKNDFDAWPKDLATKYVTDDKEVIQSGKRKRIEEQLQTKQGKRIWLDTIKTPIYDDKGQVIGTSGIARDITEHKLAEERLKESEQRFRTIFDGAIDGLLLADPKTRKFFAANQACCKMLGYTSEELANLSVKDIHPKAQLKRVLQDFEKQARKEIELAEDIPVKRKDGSIFYADINTALITLAGKTYVMGVFRDVTERKIAKDNLRKSEEKYRTVVESSGAVVCIYSENGLCSFMNNIAAERLGGKPQDYIGKRIHDMFPKKVADGQLRLIQRAIKTGEAINTDMEVQLKGKIRWYNVSINTLTTDNTTLALILARDISELKKAREELELYRGKMARAEQLASLGTISATLSHELNQPLTAIRLFIENSLAKMNKSQQPGGVTDGLKDSLKEIETVTSIVDRFRNFARQSSEKSSCQVNIKTVAQRILALLNEAAQRANISLICKDMDNLPLIYLNEKDLEQVFFALMENAIQAADGKNPKRLTISGNVKNGMLELRFADNCKGIPPENLDKIFEPFFTTKPQGEGTGLGLCIIQRILSGYGGKIRVDSKNAKGATFYATLPIHQNNIG